MGGAARIKIFIWRPTLVISEMKGTQRMFHDEIGIPRQACSAWLS